jgi:hypothetical protein
MALSFLRPRDRATVKAAIRRLKGPDSAALVLASAVKALTPEPMYLMQAGPEWRIIFQETENNEIEILDVVLEDRLRAFAKKYAEAEESLAKENTDAVQAGAKKNTDAEEFIAKKNAETAEVSRPKKLGDLKSLQTKKLKKKAPKASKPG